MQKKRILAILLAVVMVLGLCSMASATAPADRVQINNMMVDAALAEEAAAKTTEVATLSADDASTADGVVLLSSTTTVDYPPIQNITMGSKGTLYADDNGTNVQYFLHVPGGNKEGTKTFNFTLSSTTTYASPIVLTYAGSNYNLVRGETTDVAMTLTNGVVEFDVAWDETHNSTTTHHTAHCVLTVDVSQSVDISDNGVTVTNVSGATAVLDSLSVGGVTRYTCTITLPAGSSNTSLNVKFTLASAYASATLGGAAPSNTVRDTKNDVAILTFKGINFSSAKDLVITNGSASRTYAVSAAAAGSTVTVYFALRTYLADEWINNRTTYYDYSSNGFGSGEDLSASDLAEVTTASSDLAAWNIPNAPESLDSVHNNRPIFAQNSYEEIEIDASASVMDVLKEFIRRHQSITTEITDSTTYISELVCNGNTLGEFSCGYGSGWMYTARTNRTDTISALPNAGASLWSISEGMYIDWYYTAAYGMDFGYSMFG